MTYQQFKNLVDIGQLKEEPGDQSEFDGLVRSGRSRLNDARGAGDTSLNSSSNIRVADSGSFF